MSLDTPKQPTYKTKYNRLPFMDLKQGTRIVRILDEKAKGAWTHYLPKQKVSIECLGETCPICATNKQIVYEHPGMKIEGLKKIDGFLGSREVYSVNVLDKTICKICPNCGTQNYSIAGAYSPQCSKCETIIVEVVEAESNTVKLLQQGSKLFDELDLAERATRENFKLANWTMYDISISTAKGKTTRDVTRMVQVLQDRVDPIPQEVLDKRMVLSSALINLVPDEISQAIRGVSLKDIFAARNAVEEAEKLDEVSAEVKAEADQLAKDILDA